jgi:oxygen-independent coproporphyrinogen III oxidase
VLNLLKKYNVPGPRYTSYPTFPSWTGIELKDWSFHFKKMLNSKEPGLSIYIHVPFCKTLCAFCGCNKMITQNYSYADEFIDTLHKEFSYFEEMIPPGTDVFEIHLGGGSPSWLKPQELKRLLDPILNSPKLRIHKEILEQSIELDPRTTTPEHCQALRGLGFNRVSLGVQDTNPLVLKSIRRDQPLELVTKVVNGLKENEIELINMDLVYGLPFQTTESIRETIKDILILRPTRLALYSYAHVPSKSPSQKLLERDGLPSPGDKSLIHEIARELLISGGYQEIGMDHFALPSDSLYKSYIKKELHRNFMGYTVQRSKVLLGLGPSSLSDAWTAFSQNEKDYKAWRELILKNGNAIIHGHILSERELYIRRKILDLMCEFETTLTEDDLGSEQKEKIKNLIADEILTKKEDFYQATPLGRHFIRNICMAIDDSYLKSDQVFSKTL